MNNEKYILEYWVDSDAFTGRDLEQKLSKDLEELDVDFKIKEERDYHVLKIKDDKKNIDACHHHLSFDREEAFRAKDELGDELRLKAYPVLAEIETRLRRFITRAMIEVLGFNWWETSTSENIRTNVKKIESKAGPKQTYFHHPIEFTMFDDLINIVTTSYQVWPDGKEITASDLADLLKECNSIEELSEKVENKRKTISIWENVFANYFSNKEAWLELKQKVRDVVIPIRNKVMHHRLMRLYELRKLKECRDGVNDVMGSAKSELASGDFQESLRNIKTALESIRFQVDPKILKALKQPIIDPEVMQSLQRPLIDPSVIKSLQKPIIDSGIIKGIIPKFNFGLRGLEDDSDSNSEDNQKKSDNDTDGEKADKE